MLLLMNSSLRNGLVNIHSVYFIGHMLTFNQILTQWLQKLGENTFFAPENAAK
jgi:hypothetical protein